MLVGRIGGDDGLGCVVGDVCWMLSSLMGSLYLKKTHNWIFFL